MINRTTVSLILHTWRRMYWNLCIWLPAPWPCCLLVCTFLDVLSLTYMPLSLFFVNVFFFLIEKKIVFAVLFIFAFSFFLEQMNYFFFLRQILNRLIFIQNIAMYNVMKQHLHKIQHQMPYKSFMKVTFLPPTSADDFLFVSIANMILK